MRSLISFLALFLCCLACSKPDPGAVLDEYLKALEASRAPGVAVAVMRGDETLFEKGYGLANLAEGTKIDAHTRFELASVSKQFTALAVMLLKQENKLAYDDRVTRFLPELAAFAGSVTIRHLLQHIGGFPSYMELCALGRPVYNRDVLDLMVQKGKLESIPGSIYSYSNTGYSLLALVIERAGGISYPRFLQQRIFEPLEMKGTLVNEGPFPELPNVALGYSAGPRFKAYDGPEIRNCNSVYGDGSIFSSLSDQLRWHEALDHKRLLAAAVFEEALQPGKLLSGETFPYGFGWRLDPVSGHPAIAHGGAWAGFNHRIVRLSDDGLRIIVLSNQEGLPLDELVGKIIGLY